MTKALVIGGGVGGLVAAAALRRAGLDPVVYEAHPSPAGGVDPFLTLAPNGLAALRTVGMLEPVRDAARFTTTRIEFVNGSGHRLGLLGDEAHLPPELRSVSISRAALQRVVTECVVKLGVAVEYDKRLTNYTESASGVVAEFTDGTTAGGGQGASLAVADALDLARCLRDQEGEKEKVLAGLAAYQHARQDSRESVTVARRAGRKSNSPAPVTLIPRDLALRVVFGLMRCFGSRGWPIDQHGQIGPGSPEHPGNRR